MYLGRKPQIELDKNFAEFESLSERDRKFLVKFSCPWDVKFAISEGIDLKKMADLVRQCLRERIARENHENARQSRV